MASVKEIREKVKQKRLSDLLTKHQAGKTSVTEVKELDALLAERENLEKPKENVCNWKCSIVQLSELFMVTKKTICDWVKKGMPKDSYSVYDLKKVFPWWLENINSGPEDRDEDITEAKRQYWTAKAESERLKVDKEKENLFPKSEILQEWVGRVGEIKAGLRSLEVRLPPVLEGKNQEEMGDIIEKETWLLLDTYSRNGRFTPKPVEKKTIKKGNKK